MANWIMKSNDAVSGRMAELYITISNRRYNFGQLINCEFKIDKDKGKVPRVGAIMDGHKSYGMEGTFSGTIHYNQSVMRQLMMDFKNTGIDPYFDAQLTNDDPGSAAGRQTVTFFDCNADGGTLAKMDADGEYLDEDIDGTFEDFTMPEKFNELSGFRAN